MSKKLKEAIEANDLAAVREAAGKVKDLGRKLPGSTTPVLLASVSDADKALEALVEAGAEVKGSDKYEGNHPFAAAAKAGKTKVMRLMLERGWAPPTVVRFALERAGMERRAEVVRFLVEEMGIRPEASAVRLAIYGGDAEVVRMLAKTGDLKGWGAAEGEEGSPVLHVAAERGEPELVRVLVECGADVNGLDAVGRTPLMAAAFEMGEFGNAKGVRVVAELVKLGADGARRDAQGNDALDHYWFASLRNETSPNVEGALRKAGAKGSEATVELFKAVRAGDVGRMQEAIRAGADVNRVAPPNVETTPLAWATDKGTEVVGALLKAGAEVNKLGRRGTAVVEAAGSGHLEVVKQLVEAGADVEIVEERRAGSEAQARNAYLAAEWNDKFEVMEYLRSIGSGRPRVKEWKPLEAGVHSWNDFEEILAKGEVKVVAEALAKVAKGRVMEEVYGKFVRPGRVGYVVARPRGMDWCNVFQVAPPPRRVGDEEARAALCTALAKAAGGTALNICYSDTSDAVWIARYEADGTMERDEGWDRESLEEAIEGMGDEAPAWMKEKLAGMGGEGEEELVSTQRLKKLAKEEKFVVAAMGIYCEPGREVEVSFLGLPQEAFDGVVWVEGD